MSEVQFSLLDDEELSGLLDDVPLFSTEHVTVTQVLQIHTQDLINPSECTVKTSHAIEAASSSISLSSIDRKPLSTININTTSAVMEKTQTSSSRFAIPVTGQQIREKNSGAVPKKTRSVNNWAVKVWAEWARHRNAQPMTVLEPGFPIPEDIAVVNDSMINYWGQRFVMEIKRQDAVNYPPNTLHQLVCGLQRYLSDCGRQYVNFLKEGSQLNDFRKSLDTRMKELFALGIGIKKSQSDPVTMEDEIQLWESGVFSTSTAGGLSSAVFYYNGKLFGFRGFQEHVNCQANQSEIVMDKEIKLRFIMFTPGQRKNAQGGLKNRKFEQDPVRHYEQPDKVHNLVELYERYLSLIPRVGPMYRKPLTGMDEDSTPRFSAATIAHNGIKSMMKRFFTEAGIDVSERKVTNHSARVSLCTTLYNKKFTDKAVISRSKHRSNAVQSYQREQFDIMNEISGALEPDLKKAKFEKSASAPTATVTTESFDAHISTDITGTLPDPYMKPPVNCHETTSTCMDNLRDSLVIHVPGCVKNLVIIKSDGQKMSLDN